MTGELRQKKIFYINREEDSIVYRNLLNYVSPEIKKKGKLLLRNLN